MSNIKAPSFSAVIMNEDYISSKPYMHPCVRKRDRSIYQRIKMCQEHQIEGDAIFLVITGLFSWKLFMLKKVVI